MFDFRLEDVLEQDTVSRSEFALEPIEFNNEPSFESEINPASEVNKIEFEEREIEEEEEEQETPFTLADAKASAEVLIDLIDTLNVTALTPLARWKLTKKRGGKKSIQRMQEIAEKNFTGEELTPEEKRLLYQYNAYLADKEQLEKAIPYTEDEKQRLTNSAIPMMLKNKWKIGGGGSFAMELAMIQGTRVLQILTA